MKNFFIVLMLTGLAHLAVSQRLLTLPDALSVANQMSPTIRQARLSLEQSRENLNAQRAALKSKFALDVSPFSYSNKRTYDDQLGWSSNETKSSGGVFQVMQPILATDGIISLNNQFGWQDSYSTYGNNSFNGFHNNLSLTLDQPVFTYNKTKMNISKLEYALENSMLNYQLRLLSVEKSVTQAFYDVYQAQKDLVISQEEYDNRTKSYDIIKNKVDAGLVAKEEFFQAELDMLTSKSSLQNNKVSLENMLDNFKQLLGVSFDEEITVLAEISVTPVQVDMKKALSLGLTNRMELRQRQIDIEVGQFDLITTNALNEFKGNIGLTYGIMGENADIDQIYDDPSDNQELRLSMTIPIFDWGEKKARMRAAQASQNSLVINMEQENVTISLGIRQIYRNLDNLLNQIDIAKKNLENAELTYDINLEKYRNGDLTSMDLNLVQNQLTQKKQSLTSAQIQYKMELLNLKIQTLFDFEKNISIVPNLSTQK
jgi:outer membrane protein